MKRKTKGLSYWKKKLDSIFSKYIRLKAADKNGYVRCYTCGKQFFWKEIQAGHLFSRKHLGTRWDELNVEPQCYRCNVLFSGNYIVYTKRKLKELGEKKFDELEKKAHTIKKYTAKELEEMYYFYKEKVKKIAQEKGLDVNI